MTCPYQYFTIVFALVFLTVIVSMNNLSVICLHSPVICCCFKSMFLVRVTLIGPHSHGQKMGTVSEPLEPFPGYAPVAWSA